MTYNNNQFDSATSQVPSQELSCNLTIELFLPTSLSQSFGSVLANEIQVFHPFGPLRIKWEFP